MTEESGPWVLVTGRQGGKTSQLIEWFFQGEMLPPPNQTTWSRIILCNSHTRAWQLIQEIARHPRFPPEMLPATMRHSVLPVIGAGHDLRGLPDGIELGADDAELLLQLVLRTNKRIGYMTVTGDLVAPKAGVHSGRR